jgi:hypothetical protein
MEMNMKETTAMRISRELSSLQIMIDQKQLENVEYFNYLDSITTNDARCTRDIKSSIVMPRAAFSRKKNPLTNKCDLTFRE